MLAQSRTQTSPAFAVSVPASRTAAGASPWPLVEVPLLQSTSVRGADAATGHGAGGSSTIAATLASGGLVGYAVSRGRRRIRQARQARKLLVRQAPLSIEGSKMQDGHAVSPPIGYCEAVDRCVRRKTRTVTIGSVKVGSEHRIATQTMATTLTHDVEATVAQIKKCADEGIDIVRVTVQGMREAKACEHIKRRLLEEGYSTPIVADIHFTPKVAMVVADFVDKVRVNPGNFADGRKSFDTISELTDADVAEARDAIEEALVPLVLKLKDQGKALRIGVNHGSMAERIVFQYGDTPEGMVASAIEFGEICRKHGFHNFVFSMKSSNPQVMVQAYRLLAREMYQRGWDYPLHFGVTEAGGGKDGRIKSGVGIGALLLDGLGDTMRVSLTEDPELEAGPCKALRRVAEEAEGQGSHETFQERGARREGRHERRRCEFPLDVPLNADGSVLAAFDARELEVLSTSAMCERLGLRLRADGDTQKDWTSVDALVVNGPISASAGAKLRTLLDVPVGVLCRPGEHVPEGATLLYDAPSIRENLAERLGGRAVVFNGEEPLDVVRESLSLARPRLILFRPKRHGGVTCTARRFFSMLASIERTPPVPVVLWLRYEVVAGESEDELIVRASASFGSLFVDGLGEGMLWEADSMNAAQLREASFNLLQASRMRISKTEFISCPSCGRTLFNLQETTAMIQERTGHLPGVRIAVMGCIVNGPGEMADADFGYVGSGVGKVDLYVGYDCVRRGIPSGQAVGALVELIKEHERWQEPPEDEFSDDELLQDCVVAVSQTLGTELIGEIDEKGVSGNKKSAAAYLGRTAGDAGVEGTDEDGSFGEPDVATLGRQVVGDSL